MTIATAIYDWLRERVHETTETIRQLLLWAIGLGLITHDFQGREWTDVHTVLTISAASAVLALIASKSTVSAHKVEVRKQEAFDKGVVEGVRQMSSGTGDAR